MTKVIFHEEFRGVAEKVLLGNSVMNSVEDFFEVTPESFNSITVDTITLAKFLLGVVQGVVSIAGAIESTVGCSSICDDIAELSDPSFQITFQSKFCAVQDGD